MNGWRDAAQHDLLKVSEQQLYVALQGAVTLFEDLMASVFDDTLSAHVPSRVLPVSTEPPRISPSFLTTSSRLSASW